MQWARAQRAAWLADALIELRKAGGEVETVFIGIRVDGLLKPFERAWNLYHAAIALYYADLLNRVQGHRNQSQDHIARIEQYEALIMGTDGNEVSEILKRGIADLRSVEVQMLKLSQSPEMYERGISHLRSVESQELKLRKPSESYQPRVGHLRTSEVQISKLRQPLEMY